jgi:hypothetical protein
MLATMMRERLCRNQELDCLTESECRELLRQVLPGREIDPDFRHRVYTQSRGNPLLVLQLVRELASGNGHGPAADGNGAHWNGDGADFLKSLELTHLAHVDGTTRRVFELLAAANVAAVSLRDLRLGAGLLEPPLSDAQLLDALDRGLELSLLEERGRGYGFRHPLIGTALHEGLPRHRREQLRDALARTKGGRGLECACGSCPACSGSAQL